jgi:hypothetical protein
MSSMLGYWLINANHTPQMARYRGKRSVGRVMSVMAGVMPVMAGRTAAAWPGKPRTLDVRMIPHDFRSPRADPRDGRVLVTGPHAPWHDRGSHASPSTRPTPRAEPAVMRRVRKRVAMTGVG